MPKSPAAVVAPALDANARRTKPPEAYVVGLRYSHHARHSGYSGFARHIGTPLRTPVQYRWLSGRIGPVVDAFAAGAARRPRASLSLLLLEAAVSIHMRRHSGVLYHVLHGDTDFSGRSRRVALPRQTRHISALARRSYATGNRIVATFHKPASVLRAAGVEPDLIRTLDGAVLVSSSQRDYFDGLLEPDRIHVVHHGIDVDFFRPVPTLPDDAVCVTAGSYLRDFRCLAECMRHVWSANPGVRLIAVGTRRYGDRNLQELDDPRVEFLDDVDDESLRAAYQRARVAIFSLEDCTANNALLEAMACGLPIVATDVGGVSEYAGDACILCAPRDPHDLAHRLLHVFGNARLAERMRVISRARAAAHDYGIVARELEDAYASIIALPPNGGRSQTRARRIAPELNGR